MDTSSRALARVPLADGRLDPASLRQFLEELGPQIPEGHDLTTVDGMIGSNIPYTILRALPDPTAIRLLEELLELDCEFSAFATANGLFGSLVPLFDGADPIHENIAGIFTALATSGVPISRRSPFVYFFLLLCNGRMIRVWPTGRSARLSS